MDPTSSETSLGASDSARGSPEGFDTSHRPNLSVEEVPAQEITPTVEVVPQPVAEAPVVEIVPPPPSSSSPNVMVKHHPLRKLLFLIPAVLLVATIYFVARVTGNNYTMRAPAPTITPLVTEALVVAAPTPTPVPTKLYKNIYLLVQMTIPEDYEVLDEKENSVSIGEDNTELLTIYPEKPGFTDFTEAEVEEIRVGGKDAVKASFDDQWQIVVNELIINFFVDSPEKEEEFQKIIDSIIFLVDTSGWQTFENTTFNYTIKYPSEWTLTAEKDEKEGIYANKSEISRDASNKTVNNLVIQTSSNLTNAALTASEIISSTRTLSGWSNPPKIELKKLGGGDAQVIQGELTGKWRAYVVIWYKNTVIQMTWDDNVDKGEQQVFDNMLASFEFTN